MLVQNSENVEEVNEKYMQMNFIEFLWALTSLKTFWKQVCPTTGELKVKQKSNFLQTRASSPKVANQRLKFVSMSSVLWGVQGYCDPRMVINYSDILPRNEM